MNNKAQRFRSLYYRIFIWLCFLCVLVSSLFAYGNDSFELSCGNPLTPKSISRLLLQHNNLKSVEVIEVMNSCPQDPVLERMLFIIYSKEGSCRTALEFMEYKKEKGSKAFPSTYYHSDYEGVFFCYYMNAKYREAMLFYEDYLALFGSTLYLGAREAYAQSLYAEGRLNQAIGVLQEIELLDYAVVSKQAVERAAYLEAVLSLSQLLFVKGDFEESIEKAKKYLKFLPEDREGYEVLLAAVVQPGVNSNVDKKELYCDLLRLKVIELSDNPEPVKDDMALLKEMVFMQDSFFSCE